MPKNLNKNSKLKKKPETWESQQHLYGPAFAHLISHLQEKGIVGKLYTQFMDQPDLGIGNYNINDKSIALIANNSNSGNRTLAHELSHAVYNSDIESKTKRLLDHEYSRPVIQALLGINELAVPRSYLEEDKIPAPMAKNLYEGHPTSITNATHRSRHRRVNEVLYSIPEGQRWSGLSGSMMRKNDRDYDEGQAYYFTDPDSTNRPMPERAKEFGMFLLDYGIPMNIVEGVVKELGEVKPPKYKYSGGSYELNELRESNNK